MTVINVTGSCTINVVGSAVINVQEQEGGGGGPTQYITNGDFSDGLNGWINPDPEQMGDVEIVDGRASSAAAGGLYRVITPLTVGQQYTLSCNVYAAGDRTLRINLAAFSPEYSERVFPETGGWTTGAQSVTFTADAAYEEFQVFLSDNGTGTLAVDNVSLVPA